MMAEPENQHDIKIMFAALIALIIIMLMSIIVSNERDDIDTVSVIHSNL